MAASVAEGIYAAAREHAERARRANGHASGPQDRAPPEWPESDLSVLSPHREPAPPLPADAFGTAWGEWIAAAAEAKGAPPDFVAAALLPAAGALLATRRRGARWSGWAEPPVLWCACVGRPSTNKSPGIDAAADPLRALEAELDADLPERRREHRTREFEAKLAREAREDEAHEAVKGGLAPPLMPALAEAPDPPQPRRLLTSDPTPEPPGTLEYRKLPPDLVALSEAVKLEDRPELSGSASGSFTYALLSGAVWSLNHNAQPDDGSREVKKLAASAFLKGVVPRDPIEDMIAAQMLGLHDAAMECLRRGAMAQQTFEGRQMNLA